MNKKSLLLLSLILTLAGCEEALRFEFSLPNDYYDSIFCYVPKKKEPWVKDTTIFFSRDDLRLIRLHTTLDGRKTGAVELGLFAGLDNQFSYRWKTDTISIFLFDPYVVSNYSWEEIVENYYVLKRYDLSKADIERLRYNIPYPPTEEMRNMHMFPPYGND